ncbi:MAG: hypothetical protein RLZZ528_40 [Pseudomonadota bacterium]|jgi:drug/metabolite transporter (DMT)-like permease
MTGHRGLLAFLFLLGTGWGLTHSLSNIAVSTGYRPFGLIFWQLAIGALALGVIVLIRGQGFPLRARTIGFAALIAFVGTIFPNFASYAAYPHLPAGIMSIVTSAVPLLAYPLAVALGIERYGTLRTLGLLLGVAGVALIALPDASLPDPKAAPWLAVAMIAPFFYALEANVVAKWGTAGLDPIQAMFGAAVVGAIVTLPMALGSGQWIDPMVPWGRPEWALILSSTIHAFMYAGYVWLVGRAGAVFAAQSSYVVTGAGVFWSMLILGETYSLWVWSALAVLLLGVFLVQPRHADAAMQQVLE